MQKEGRIAFTKMTRQHLIEYKNSCIKTILLHGCQRHLENYIETDQQVTSLHQQLPMTYTEDKVTCQHYKHWAMGVDQTEVHGV